VWDGADWAPVDAAQQRVVLAILLAEAGRVVTTERLVEEIWAGRAPRAAVSTVQNLVMRLRARLGRGPLLTRGRGYELVVADGDVDARRYENLVVAGRHHLAEGRLAPAVDKLAEALALWRARALADVPASPTVDAYAAKLEQSRLTALEERLGAELELGRHHAVVDELHGLVGEHPLRERLRAQLMLALYRSGRRGEALEVYRQGRQELVEQIGLDPGPQLRDLHRAILADESGLAAPGSPVTAGRTRDQPPAQLPADPSGFVGRAEYLARLAALLPDAGRLSVVTLAGTAGVGKTALAVHWGHKVRDRFPDGQLFVDLRGYSSSPPVRPIDALAHLLPALGVPPERVPADEAQAAATYRTALADKRMLVLLDNARHPEQVRPLLPGSAGCLVLVTSRDQMAGLVARDGAVRLTLDVLSAPEAHALLTRLVGADLVRVEPDAVAELAGLCGYLPLALRIAAARLTAGRWSGIAEYASRLRTDRLAALRIDGDPEAALQTALDSSYAGLPPAARRVFRLLGLVPGPDVTAEAAAALANVSPADAAGLLSRLADVHLAAEHALGRYALHDLVRLYAAYRAATEEAAAHQEAALDRLYGFYACGADGAARLLYPQLLRAPAPDPGASFDDDAHATAWLDAERANLVAAVRQAAERGRHTTVWRLADLLRGYFHHHRYLVDWSVVAEAGLAAADAAGDLRGQAAAHLGLAMLADDLGRSDDAIAEYTASIRCARWAGWAEAESAGLGNLGSVYWALGRVGEAAEHISAGLVIDRRGGWRAGQAAKLVNLGNVCWASGQVARAVRYQVQAVAIHRQEGSLGGEAIARGNLGEMYLALGRLDAAVGALTSALELVRKVGSRHTEADATRVLAAVHRHTGDHREALRLATTAVAIARETNDHRREAAALTTEASIHHRMGRPGAAISACRRAVEVARAIGDRYVETEALAGLADGYLGAGQPGRGAGPARVAVALASRAGYRLLEGCARTSLAEVYLAQSRYERALRHASAALAAHRETGYRLGLARTSRAAREARRRLRRRTPEPPVAPWLVSGPLADRAARGVPRPHGPARAGCRPGRSRSWSSRTS
jgi:DNA-binding SARP family transcriptional activator